MTSPSVLRVGLVQLAFDPNPLHHQKNLQDGIADLARNGVQLVSLQELTLNTYFCTSPSADPLMYAEDIATGPTYRFLSEQAIAHKVAIAASLVEKSGQDIFNTAIAIAANGELIGKTRKQHIPSGLKYHEDYYFKPGDSDYPIHNILNTRCALPTCYDQWFPELSRIYGLKDVELIIYPTAIGTEPTALEVDTQPIWQKVMVAQGIMANTFIIATNRIGTEDGLTCYGSSFIGHPMGRILAQAPRDKACTLYADLDFSVRELWGRLFPFAKQRQPNTYHQLTEPQPGNPSLRSG